MASRKDVKKELAKLEKEGFIVEHGLRTGHVKIIDPDTGQVVGNMGKTPSDWRSIKNFRAQMRPARMALAERRKERRMPYVPPDPELMEREVEVRDRVQKAIDSLDASIADFADFAADLGRERNMQVYKNEDSARMALSRFLRGGRPMPWAADLYDAAVEEFTSKPTTNGDTPLYEGPMLVEPEPTEAEVQAEEQKHTGARASWEEALEGAEPSAHDLSDYPSMDAPVSDPPVVSDYDEPALKPVESEEDLLQFPLHMRTMVGLMRSGLDIASVLTLVEEIRRMEKRLGIY